MTILRYLTVAGGLILIVLIARQLLSRRQQRAVHEFVTLFAKILLIASLLMAVFLYVKRL